LGLLTLEKEASYYFTGSHVFYEVTQWKINIIQVYCGHTSSSRVILFRQDPRDERIVTQDLANLNIPSLIDSSEAT